LRVKIQNIWELSKECCKDVHIRKYADAEVGRVRYLAEEDVYSATISEFENEFLLETTKYFDILLEAVMWVDITINTIFEIPMPEEIPKGSFTEIYFKNKDS